MELFNIPSALLVISLHLAPSSPPILERLYREGENPPHIVSAIYQICARANGGEPAAEEEKPDPKTVKSVVRIFRALSNHFRNAYEKDNSDAVAYEATEFFEDCVFYYAPFGE